MEDLKENGYKYGKRWYCSWVCGCGGLAETAGDPWRHLSDKSMTAWKIERWMIHAVLLFSFIMTIAVVYSYLGGDESKYSLTRNGFTVIMIGLLLALAAGCFWLCYIDSCIARYELGFWKWQCIFLRWRDF